MIFVVTHVLILFAGAVSHGIVIPRSIGFPVIVSAVMGVHDFTGDVGTRFEIRDCNVFGCGGGWVKKET